MAMDPRKRQKKLERRKAKEKAKRKAFARQGPNTLAARIERAAVAAPILHCCTTEVLWEEGMSNILISRELKSGSVAFAMFLLDVYCLGVKDAMSDIVPRSRYDWQVYDKLSRYQIVNLEPDAARKLIEGAVEYARELGLSPHSDYRRAKRIFGDIDADFCTEEFVFGKDGKPYFIAGPNDSRARCNEIISTLTARCGPDGFHCLVPAAAGTMVSEGEILSISDLDDLDAIEEESF